MFRKQGRQTFRLFSHSHSPPSRVAGVLVEGVKGSFQFSLQESGKEDGKCWEKEGRLQTASIMTEERKT